MRGLFLPDSSRGKYESNNANSRTLREHGQGLGVEGGGRGVEVFVSRLSDTLETGLGSPGKSFM